MKSIEELIEQAKDIKIVFFDIDDTLRLKKEDYMPESVLEVFRKLKEKGVLTGIATGRILNLMPEEVRALEADYLVTINGQYVVANDGEEIFENSFPPDKLSEMLESLKEQQANFAFASSRDLVVAKWDEITHATLDGYYNGLEADSEFNHRHRIYQILTFSEDADTLVIPEHLQDTFRFVKWYKYSNDILPLHGSKANGIQKVLDKLNLLPENVLVFGDELNDLEMFEHAGLAVAMGNAHEQLKPLADFVTKPVEEDGILYALEQFKLI
ncbi:MAG: Cof-type HAD-IIB family hydrolase [Streptococcaceae bacterium]|jgi:Cof subfamily protein (haloacid dehalogenase superfamily)|nr:Cof-type HAD-IIB family hydrolase [Streptococcaceae bacterium]